MVKTKKKGTRRPKSKLKHKAKHHFHNLKHTHAHRSFQKTILDHRAIEHVNKQIIILGISILGIILLAVLLMYQDNFAGKAVEVNQQLDCEASNLCLWHDSFSFDSMTVNQGDTFDLTVVSNLDSIVTGVMLNLSYDETVLQLDSSQSTGVWSWENFDNSEDGLIQFSAFNLEGLDYEIGGLLETVTLTFTVIGNVGSSFDFEFSPESEIVNLNVDNILLGVMNANLFVEEGSCPDADGDGYDVCVPGDIDGDDDGNEPDCDDGNPNINPGTNEICNDRSDQDCDGFIDCRDTDCESEIGFYGETCEPNGELTCDDLFDNDADGLIDCYDITCFEECDVVESDCVNHQDDEGDGLTDCDDPDCVWHYECGGVESICNDGLDNDGDGEYMIDCADADCANDILCTDVDADGYNDAEDCDDNDALIHTEIQAYLDNDGDGYGVGTAETLCTDGNVPEGYSLTNDDCDDEPSLMGDGYGFFVNPNATEICYNLIDDDCDTLIDCADTETCIAEVGPYGGLCESPEISCDDELDNDGDTYVDCNDPDCNECYFGASCTDADGDNYYVEVGCGIGQDCDDTNAAVNPGVVNEVCGDGYDNNCNGYVDCDPGGVCQDIFGNGVVCDFAGFEVGITVTEGDLPFNVGAFDVGIEYNITVAVLPLLEDLPDNHLVIVQVTNSSGTVQEIFSEYQSSLMILESEEVSFFYTPQESGTYFIEAFVWSDWLDLEGNILLSSVEEDFS